MAPSPPIDNGLVVADILNVRFRFNLIFLIKLSQEIHIHSI